MPPPMVHGSWLGRAGWVVLALADPTGEVETAQPLNTEHSIRVVFERERNRGRAAQELPRWRNAWPLYHRVYLAFCQVANAAVLQADEACPSASPAGGRACKRDDERGRVSICS